MFGIASPCCFTFFLHWLHWLPECIASHAVYMLFREMHWVSRLGVFVTNLTPPLLCRIICFLFVCLFVGLLKTTGKHTAHEHTRKSLKNTRHAWTPKKIIEWHMPHMNTYQKVIEKHTPHMNTQENCWKTHATHEHMPHMNTNANHWKTHATHEQISKNKRKKRATHEYISKNHMKTHQRENALGSELPVILVGFRSQMWLSYICQALLP